MLTATCVVVSGAFSEGGLNVDCNLCGCHRCLLIPLLQTALEAQPEFPVTSPAICLPVHCKVQLSSAAKCHCTRNTAVLDPGREECFRHLPLPKIHAPFILHMIVPLSANCVTERGAMLGLDFPFWDLVPSDQNLGSSPALVTSTLTAYLTHAQP